MAFGISNRNFDTVIVMDAILISFACLLIIFVYREISQVPMRHAEEIAGAITVATDDFAEDNALSASLFDELGSIQFGQRYRTALAQARSIEPAADISLYIDHPIFSDLSAQANPFRIGALRGFKSGTAERLGGVVRIGGALKYRLATPVRAFRDCRRCEAAGMASFEKGDVIGVREVTVPVANPFGLSGRKLLYASAMLVCALLVFVGFILPVFNRSRRESAKISDLAHSFEQQATTDSLTGLHNRRFFEHALKSYLEEMPTAGKSVGLLLLDLDHFKEINDEHGHPCGDLVLKDVALRLLTISRQSDIVARIGGEEFAVIVPYVSREQIDIIAERYREHVAQMRVVVGNAELRPTISIGIATSDDGETTMDGLMQAADRKLYEAKRNGRNRVAA
jgi:diguanylate cyclase (GGDEF)-like protein